MTEIKNFNDFLNEVREYFENKYGENAVNICKITKNNGVIYTGLSIRIKGETVSPTVYLDSFYNMLSDSMDIGTLLNKIDEVYSARRLGRDVRFDSFKDYSIVREHLRCKLINYEANENMLANIPHRCFMDLAIVPYYLLGGNEIAGLEDDYASITIKNEHLALWDVTAQEIISTAIDNTMQEEETEITTIAEMFRRIQPDLSSQMCDDIAALPMYVMTNSGCHGAVSMLDRDRLTSFCNLIESDVYIIPSSIKEVILIPNAADCDEDYLNEMVREVNETQLNPVEVLADHVYYFDRYEGYREAV